MRENQKLDKLFFSFVPLFPNDFSSSLPQDSRGLFLSRANFPRLLLCRDLSFFFLLLLRGLPNSGEIAFFAQIERQEIERGENCQEIFVRSMSEIEYYSRIDQFRFGRLWGREIASLIEKYMNVKYMYANPIPDQYLHSSVYSAYVFLIEFISEIPITGDLCRMHMSSFIQTKK